MPRPATEPWIVCFDLGGVLVQLCHSWEEACQVAAIPVRTLPEASARQRRAVASAYERGHIDEQRFYTELADATGGAYSAREIAAVHHAWTRTEYPGVAGLLTQLRTLDGIRIACLSNTNAAHWRRLSPEAPGPDDEYPSLAHIEIKLASHLLGLAKPDLDIYHAARQRFGVAAESVVFFDDLPENVASARSAGWRAHAIDPHGDPVAQIRSHLIGLGILGA